MTTPVPSRPRRLDPAQRWWLEVGGLVAALVAALPPLTHLYSGDVLATVYGLVALSLLCEAAETLDARAGRRGGDRAGASRPEPAGPSLSGIMRGVVCALAVYTGLVGLAGLAGGSGGDASSRAGGALLAGASALSLLLFWAGTARVPGFRHLRPGHPISWLAVLAVLQAFAQNLAPSSGTASVASAIARPVTAGDLIVGSLPYGAVAALAVGPAVRRQLPDWARRLGLWPLDLRWAVAGIVLGVLLVPGLEHAFSSSGAAAGPAVTVAGSRLLLADLAVHLLPAMAAGVAAVAVAPLRRRLAHLLIAPRGTEAEGEPRAALAAPARRAARQSVVDALLLLGLVVVVGDAAGYLTAVLADRLPADCLAQQAQVSQSLSGGPTGRPAYENIAIALVAGVDEELLFRGVLQPRIGLLLASLLFASFHLQYTCHGLPSVGDLEIVGLGLVFGLVRREGGLLAAILCHAAYDSAILLNLPIG